MTSSDASAHFNVDANDGHVRLKYNLFENQIVESQGAIVSGTGVLNDTKKVSVKAQSGTYVADDQLRPPSLRTFDLRGNLTAALNVLNGVTTLGTVDLATDPSTTWTDGANVDGHTYEGYTHDYYFKRFGLAWSRQQGCAHHRPHPYRAAAGHLHRFKQPSSGRSTSTRSTVRRAAATGRG